MQTKATILKTSALAILTLMTAYAAHAGGRHPRFDETRTTNMSHVADAGLHIRTDNGAITVTRSDRADVEIVANIRCVSPERLEAVEIIAERQGDNTLKVYAKWPGGKRKNNEGCSFELQLPDARNLDLRTANGAIKCGEFSGSAQLNTSNGKITVSSHDGPVNANTSNGAIHVHNIQGTLTAVTSNGKINARHIGGAAELRTSNGAVEAIDVVSPLQIRTSNGAISLELAPDFAGEMTASTSHGSLDISGIEDARLISSGKKRIVFAIGESEQKSSTSTSNGSIRIRTAP